MAPRSLSRSPRWRTRLAWQTAIYPRAPGALRLGPDEVHLWCAPLRLPPTVEQGLRLSLDDDERARAARFVAAQDRTRYVAAHGLLRHVLGCYLKTPPELVRYRYAPRGKPSLAPRAGAPPLQFNLSHSGDLALFAVTLRRRIGVDLERVRRGRDVMGIGARFFSPREVAALRALPRGARMGAFYRCWTCKEAYLKARGDGLSLPLDSFEVSLAPAEPAALLRSAEGSREVRRWALLGFAPAAGYVAALAVETGARRVVCWRLEVPPRTPEP